MHGDEWRIERNIDVVRMIIVVAASRGVRKARQNTVLP
jgi:hypothetical protein